MIRHPNRYLAPLAALAVATACRHLASPPVLSPDWRALQGEGSGFVALYRLSCCGHRELLATVRAGQAGVLVTAVAPPGVTVLQCWLEEGGAWLADLEGRCRRAVPAGTLHLPDGTGLPLDRGMAVALLAGRLPPGGSEDREAGWVSGASGTWRWRAQVSGSPPRCLRFQLATAGAGEVALEAELANHHGSVPGALTLRVGGTRLLATLEVWRADAGPALPAFLEGPVCTGGA